MNKSLGERLLKQIGFEPLEAQREIMECWDRFILLTGGEKSAKSYLGAKHLVKMLPYRDPRLDPKVPAVYWLVGRNYGMTKAEYDFLVEDLGKLGVLKEASNRVDPGVIELEDKSVVRTKTADDVRALAVEEVDGIILCEAGQIEYEAYLKCEARVGARRGWLFLSGTLEQSWGGLGWYAGLAQAWRFGTKAGQRSFRLASWTNTYKYPGGREDPEIKRLEALASDAWFMERMAGIPSPPRGAVFGNEFRAHLHIRDITFDPALPVTLWIDPGYAGAYAVLAVQVKGDSVYVFDEVYTQGILQDEIIATVMAKPWWRSEMMETGVIDIAARQHDPGASPIEIWQEKARYTLDSNRVLINDGIERLKTFLKPHPVSGEPRIFFAPHLKGTLSEFGAGPNPFESTEGNPVMRVYRWKTDAGGNVMGNTPDPKYNHAISAIIYGLVQRFGPGMATSRTKIPVTYFGRQRARSAAW